MKTLIFIAVLTATLSLLSCSKDVNEVVTTKEETTLGIRPTLDAPSVNTRAALSSFPNQSTIGLFVTSGALQNNYNGVAAYANVKATLNNMNWELSPNVFLSPASATIFAYYPYDVSETDPANIHVEHTSQTDYLFGTHASGQSTINSSNNIVNLTMKHALSLVQFRIMKKDYSGNAILTKIEIANKQGKTILYSEGSMNISTGIITNTSNKNASAIYLTSEYLPTTLPTVTSSFHKIMVLPTAATTTEGDIQIHFTIDSKVYTYNVPAGTKWERGKVNTYTVTLSGKNLVVNNVVIDPWQTGVNGEVTLQ